MRRLRVFIGAAVAFGAVAACADTEGADPAAPAESVVAATVEVSTTPATTGAVATPSPTTDPPTTERQTTEPADDLLTPDGYSLVAATATEPDGTVCELCLWLAETGDERSRGLMGVTDLGGADGMAFVYPSPHSGSFWMKNTLLPLSIAFYDARGAYLDAFDMDPCTADPCPSYPTPDDFLVAIEVAQGDLADVGLVSGSVLELLDETCELA